MATCLVSLGSNLGEREETLRRAAASFDDHPAIRLDALSEFHESQPVGGPTGQQPYVNAAVLLETELPAQELLDVLEETESLFGRTRGERWAPRTLDLDLLLYGDEVIETPRLVVPHPRMSFRRFVLQPAAEVAAEMRHPQIGWSIGRLLDHLTAAANYVAVTGPAGSGKTALAHRLQKHFGGRWIADAVPSLSEIDDGGQKSSREIEFLRRRTMLLGRKAENAPTEPIANASSLLVSDFWLGQSLVYAEDEIDAREKTALQKYWRVVHDETVQPKLIIALDLSGAAILKRTSEASKTVNYVARAGKLDRQRVAWDRHVRWGGHGPFLWLDAADMQRTWSEAQAAVEAMQ